MIPNFLGPRLETPQLLNADLLQAARTDRRDRWKHWKHYSLVKVCPYFIHLHSYLFILVVLDCGLFVVCFRVLLSTFGGFLFKNGVNLRSSASCIRFKCAV